MEDVIYIYKDAQSETECEQQTIGILDALETLASMLTFTVGSSGVASAAIDREDVRDIIQNKIAELVKKL